MVKPGSCNEDVEGFSPKFGVIFVFGSNLAGRHGRGAALFARKHYGAQYGVGIGRTGNAYAIPTKDRILRTLDLDDIESYVHRFIRYAKEHPALEFQLTRVGCGLAGYKDAQIAPMFRGISANVQVPEEWRPYLNEPAANEENRR